MQQNALDLIILNNYKPSLVSEMPSPWMGNIDANLEDTYQDETRVGNTEATAACVHTGRKIVFAHLI